MRRDSSSNDRIHPRFRVKEIEGSFLQSADITIVDLSVKGAGIETNTALNVGRRYRLRVYRGGVPLDLDGNVAWSRLVRTERTSDGDIMPVYRAGISFDRNRSEIASAWQQFVGSKLPEPGERRLVGNLGPSGDSPDTIDRNFDFSVDVISLSGLRILVGPQVDVQALMRQTLPIRLELDEESFQASARVLNSAPKGDEGVDGFFLGMEWTDLSQENEAMLSRYLSDETKATEETPADSTS